MKFKSALVIDDEVEIGMLLSVLLCKMGIETNYASNLTKGMQLFDETKPQLVFLDLNLPDGSGFSLVTKLKNSTIQTYIVLITAEDGANERAMAKNLGVDYIMPKPLSRNQIVEVLGQLGNTKCA
jgi:DNA-binding response OmpR family regulator